MQAAAEAGYQVLALDAFADRDTKASAAQVQTVSYAQGRFDAADFERALARLDLHDAIGLAYGSGFEADPALLEIASRYLPLVGNSPRVLKNLKQPRQFFTLLDVLGIPHPEISFKVPARVAGWLRKQSGGSGGMHVRKVLPIPAIVPQPDCYFQREVSGEPVSLLFAANGQQTQIIGYNRQFIAPSALAPYRYGGAVCHADLPAWAKLQLLDAAQRLTNAVSLRGLNSLDAIMDDERVWVLEVNPRLSATFGLYHSAQCNLFDWHLNSSAGALARDQVVAKRSRAHRIIYAKNDCVIPEHFDWPSWVADIPATGSAIPADNPLCTVIADSDSASEAERLVFARAEQLQLMIEPFGKKII